MSDFEQAIKLINKINVDKIMNYLLRFIGLQASPEEMELINDIKTSDVEIIGRGTICVRTKSSKPDDKHRKELQKKVQAIFQAQARKKHSPLIQI